MGEGHNRVARAWLSDFEERCRRSKGHTTPGALELSYYKNAYRGVVDFFYLEQGPADSWMWGLCIVDFKHAPEDIGDLTKRLQSYHSDFPSSQEFKKWFQRRMRPHCDLRRIRDVRVILALDAWNDSYLRFLDLNKPQLRFIGFDLAVELLELETGVGACHNYWRRSDTGSIIEYRNRIFGRQKISQGQMSLEHFLGQRPLSPSSARG